MTLANGDVVYLTATNTWDKANNVTALEAGSTAIALCTAAATAGNPATVLYGIGEIDLGTSIGTATDEIIVSGNDGKMAPKSDLASSDYYTRLGYMKTTDILAWEPRVTGVVKA